MEKIDENSGFCEKFASLEFWIKVFKGFSKLIKAFVLFIHKPYGFRIRVPGSDPDRVFFNEL